MNTLAHKFSKFKPSSHPDPEPDCLVVVLAGPILSSTWGHAALERHLAAHSSKCSEVPGEKALAAMGTKFSIREFHNQVLRSGSVPLDVPERNIDRWIAKS